LCCCNYKQASSVNILLKDQAQNKLLYTVTNTSQRKAAKVVGFAYLFALLPAIFAEFYVSGQLIVYNNAAETARNIIAHEQLFRLSIACNLIVFATDVVLVTALYVVLERVNRNLALLATFFRLIETTILFIVTLNDFNVLELLSGADYLRAFEADRLQALARLSVAAHGYAYNLALLLFGFGSPVFCYLWLRSGYIPKVLAAWGVIASLWVGVCAFTFIIFPAAARVVTVGYYGGPIFFFELAMGFWLLFKGINPAATKP
jgi:hypothetical protein